MSKLADDEYRSLSVLLDSLPDPSSFPTAKSMTAAAAREMGVIPEADEDEEKSVSLLEMLKTHLPNRVGGAQASRLEL
jgi:hypothetical protein